MEFRFFVAVTTLIALISQHSINGIPVNSTSIEKKCSEGLEVVNGKCVPKDSTSSETIITDEEEPVTKLNLSKNSGVCPEGMQHVQGGRCEEISPSSTTEVNIELTTNRNESAGGVENPQGCPQGTEADEQGACQEIKPSNSRKKINNLKDLLNKDGSCPDNYKRIEGRCLYIKSQTNSTRLQARNGLEQNSKIELVPVLPDNSCPVGTEYSEYGLCQKRVLPSNSTPRTKSDNSCPDEFEFVNGKCTYKKSKVNISSTPAVRKTQTMKSSTPSQDVVSSEELTSTSPSL